MPVKILGMIGTQMEGIAVHLIKGADIARLGDRIYPAARALGL